MQAFGVHFRIDRPDLFDSLESVFLRLRLAKESGEFGDINDWSKHLHADVIPTLVHLSQQNRTELSELRSTRPIAVTAPMDSIGGQWDIGDILDAVANGEYRLLEVVRTDPTEAELRIDPEAYPYGGIGVFIGLLEAHGMHVLGFNEYGKYEPRTEQGTAPPQPPSGNPASQKRWWHFWR